MRPRGRKRKIFRILAITSGTILIVILAAGIYLQSRMQDILIKEINKQLTAKVSVKEISFSFFRSFPQAQLLFKEVVIPDSQNQQIPLLQAGSLSLNFSIIDIIRKNYNIRFIGIDEGSLSLRISENGEPNYEILMKGDAESEAVGFALRKVKIRNVNVSYNDLKNNIIADVYCVNTIFRGDFSADEYNTRMAGDISINQIKIGNEGFFSGQRAYLDMVLNVDNIRSIYTFTRGNLEVEGLPFRLTGSFEHGEERREIKLFTEGDNINIGHLLKLLPEDLAFIETDYTPQGVVTFTGNISGRYDGDNVPEISFSYGIENGSLNHRKSGISLDSIDCRGTYNYSDKKNDLEIESFSAKLGNGTIKGKAELVGLNAPLYKLEIESDIEVADLLAFYPLKNISGGKGKVKINLNAETSAAFNESMSVTQLLNSRTKGEIELSDVSITTDKGDQLFNGISGRFDLDNNDVNVTALQGRFLDNQIYFAGLFSNMLPYLLIDDQSLEFSGTLKSPSLDLKKILYQGNKGNKDSKTNDDTVRLPGRINGSLDVLVDKLVYDRFTPTGIRAKLIITPEKLLAEKVRMVAFKGSANGALMLAQNSDGSYIFDCELNTESVDIRQMFKQLNNFGQSDLTDQNLEGLLTSRIRISSTLTPQLVFKMPSLEAIGELVVENGALLNYAPVKALARYTRLDDLSDIRFNTLKNEIRIADSKIIIPEMMIRSDAVDLSIAGIHSFNGDINYQVRIMLSELLSGKAKRVNRQRTDIDLTEQDQKGRITIYLLIDGTVVNPVVKYDRRSQRIKIREELKSEKEEVRDLFKKEFGIFNRSNEKPEKQSARQKEGVIIIEWDDD